MISEWGKDNIELRSQAIAKILNYIIVKNNFMQDFFKL